MRLHLFAAALLLGIAVPLPAQSDLALVPSDALGFVHVRAADLWKHDLLKGLRETAAAAGPKAIAAFEAQMYPSLSDLDTATLILGTNAKNPNGPPEVIVAVSFKNAIDAEKIRKLYLPESGVSEIGGKKYYVDKDKEIGLHFASPKLLVAGNAPTVEAFVMKAPGNGDGPLAKALAAATSKAITVAVNVKALPIPPQAFNEIPSDLRPLAMLERAVLTFDLSAGDPVLELKAMYANDTAAADAEKAVKAAINMAKQAMMQPKKEMEQKLYANADKGPQPIDKAAEAGMALMALGAIARAEQEMEKLPIAKAGSDLTAKVTIPKEITGVLGYYSAGLAMMLPAVAKVREAAGSSQSMNNLKMIGLGFHSMHDVFGKMPGAAICDKAGKPLLSWRVAMLPYLDQQALYGQFKLDEPWDSPNNKPLIEKMPKVFVSPRVETKSGYTVYKVLVGKDAMFDWKQGKGLVNITDGTSNTIMAVEAGEPVIWTKPEDIEFDPMKELPKLELPGGIKQISVLMGDGSVRRIDLNKVSAKTLKIAIGTSDGEILPEDWYSSNDRGGSPFASVEARSVPAIPDAAVPPRAVTPPPPPPPQ